MTNDQLNKLWESRDKSDSPVRNPIDGEDENSDFMTIVYTDDIHHVFERKPRTTVWQEIK